MMMALGSRLLGIQAKESMADVRESFTGNMRSWRDGAMYIHMTISQVYKLFGGICQGLAVVITLLIILHRWQAGVIPSIIIPWCTYMYSESQSCFLCEVLDSSARQRVKGVSIRCCTKDSLWQFSVDQIWQWHDSSTLVHVRDDPEAKFKRS